MELNNKVNYRLSSRLKTKEGVEIYEGDIIVFYFHEFGGYSVAPLNNEYTKMIDICYFDKGVFYAINSIGQGCFLSKVNMHCKVIGNVKDNEDLLENEFSYEMLNYMFPKIFQNKD